MTLSKVRRLLSLSPFFLVHMTCKSQKGLLIEVPTRLYFQIILQQKTQLALWQLCTPRVGKDKVAFVYVTHDLTVAMRPACLLVKCLELSAVLFACWRIAVQSFCSFLVLLLLPLNTQNTHLYRSASY